MLCQISLIFTSHSVFPQPQATISTNWLNFSGKYMTHLRAHYPRNASDYCTYWWNSPAAFGVSSSMALVGVQLIFKMKWRYVKLTIIVVYKYFISLCCVCFKSALRKTQKDSEACCLFNTRHGLKNENTYINNRLSVYTDKIPACVWPLRVNL